jgi:putative transposase
MAWKEMSVLNQRKLFIDDYQSRNFSISDLCRVYGISRPTAYFWIDRFNKYGLNGLIDKKSTPFNHPDTTPEEITDAILLTKYEWSKWGPKKIRAYLSRNTTLILPSETTIGNILKKHNLVKSRKTRSRFAERTQPLAHVKGINDVWSADFKGKFITNDNYKCEPFTLTDNESRFILKCVALDANNTEHVWAILEVAFREYGLPLYLRTDNGPPFATCGIGRLSSLAIKLIKAGVIPDYIDPGKPEQNGRHERMHGTLKAEAVFPEISLHEQRIKLEEFQTYYNFERPHEGINQLTPGSIYKPSNRVWSGKLKPPEYDDCYKKYKVRASGQIKFKGKDVFIGRALTEEYVGLKKVETGYSIYYGQVCLGKVDEKGELIFSKRPGRDRSKKFQADFY